MYGYVLSRMPIKEMHDLTCPKLIVPFCFSNITKESMRLSLSEIFVLLLKSPVINVKIPY